MDLLSVLAVSVSTVFMWIIPFLFVLTIVVFFHELGHFMVARWCGVKVSTFSVGFGKELFGFTDKQGTRWTFAAIPLGGYVKFIDDENAASVPDRKAHEEMSEKQKEGTFQSKSLGQRAAIVAAGPIANFILAIVIFAGLFTLYGEVKARAVVSEVLPNSAAKLAGLQAGDEIVAIDGRKIDSFAQMQMIVSTSAELKLNFTVLRGGQKVKMVVTPKHREINDRFNGKVKVGMIGVKSKMSRDTITHQKYDPLTAVVKGTEKTYFIIERTLTFIGGIFTGRESAKQLGGPIQIADVSSKVASVSFLNLIQLIAIISVSIGLLNLFPIPMLDGGHLLFYGIEALKGSPLKAEYQEFGFKVGMALMLFLMVFVTFNDISKKITQYMM